MGRKAEGRERSAGKEGNNIRSVQLLASKVQKAIDSGRASKRTTQDVDASLSTTYSLLFAKILHVIDDLVVIRGAAPMGKINKISTRIDKILDSFRATKGYTMLLKKNGQINSRALNQLVEVDNDMGTLLSNMLSKVSTIRSSRRIRTADIAEITSTVTILERTVSDRSSLLRQARQSKIRI